MTPEELQILKETMTALKDSGVFEQLMQSAGEPGGKTAMIYSLIGLVLMLGFRVIVVDKIVNKIIGFHKDSLKCKQQMEVDFKTGLTIFESVKDFLEGISSRMGEIQAGQIKLYQIILGRRQEDDPLDFKDLKR